MTYLQIESRHKEFFGLVCYHEYYTDLLCEDLEFEPTPDTRVLLRNYNLVFKPLKFGFLITYNPMDSPGRLKEAPVGTRFSFVVKSLNRYFHNFTDIPFQHFGKGLHFSNKHLETAIVEQETPSDIYYYFNQLNVVKSEKKLLHLPQHSEVVFRPSKFNYNVTEPIGYDKIKLLDEWGNEKLGDGKLIKRNILDVQKVKASMILRQEVKKLQAEGLDDEEIDRRIFEIKKDVASTLAKQKVQSHKFDFSHVPSGKYTIKCGKHSEDVYISDNDDNSILGMIDVHLDSVNSNALVDRNAKIDREIVKPQLFNFHFSSRKTYWRYFFMNYKQSRISPREIREESKLLNFSQPESGRLQNLGTKALISVSDVPIPLAEKPQYNIILERQIGKRAIKHLRLPFPGRSMVKPVKSKDGVMIYSDIYVYL